MDTRQTNFRKDYEDTLSNFQNNMRLLGFHSENIQRRFQAYHIERQTIIQTMQLIKDHSNMLTAHTDELEQSLDKLLERL